MKARESLEDAVLEDIDKPTLEAIIMINACTDEELKKLFLEREDASVEELDRIADNYERKMADVKGTSDIDKTYAVSTSKPNNSYQGRKQEDKDKDKNITCLRCGNKGHRRKDCRVSDNVTCGFCEIKGHTEKACKKKKEKARPVKQDSEDPSESDIYAATNRVIARARVLQDGSDTPQLLL
jgi:phosphoenolpyruvate synthase/pyruvate phosphate dikinase